MRTIGSVITGTIDYRGKTPPRSEVGIPTISAKHVKRGRVEHCGERFVSPETFDRWTTRGFIKPGDVLITTEAPVAEVARVPSDQIYLITRRVIALRVNPTEADESFLMYSMLADHNRNALANLGHGATVPRVFKGDILGFELPMPSVAVQARIGAVLETIDDLIENNRRRVAVVQEMARAIYREWFVHFRFPGHEDATFVDSDLGPMPEDWSAVSLDSVASVVRGRSYRKAELVGKGEGLPFLNLKCMQRGGGFRRDGLKWYDGQFKDAQLTGRGDIVLAVTDLTQGREILARATLVPSLPMERGVISLDVAKIVPTNPADRLWIFGALRWSDFADRVKEFANGSTVLHLSPTHVAEAMVLWASGDLRGRFADAIGPMLELANELSDAADRAAGVRDLLLPKLVTGQIDVSDLDLDAIVERAGV